MGHGWWPIASFIGRWILPPVLVLTLFGVALGGYELSREMAAQRGIDAHPRQVTATVTRGAADLGLYARERATVQFTVDGRSVTTGVHDIPGDLVSGGSVCVEVNAEEPIHARLCGSRGGVDDAWREVLIAGAAFAVSAVLWVLYLRRRRAERWRSEHPLAA